MNSVNLFGRIANDLNIKEINNGKNKILNFSLAINNTKDKASFIPITAFDALADNISKYQKKGNQIGISGFLQDNSYTDKDGKKRYVLNVVANRVDFVSNKEANKDDKITFNHNNNFKIEENKLDDDDIPF